MIQVPATRETIDRINEASAAAEEAWRNSWLTDEERTAAFNRWQAAEELGRYLFETVSIFRTVPCADCGAPARTVCSLTPMEERRPYHSQRSLCGACRDEVNEAARFEY